MFVLDYKIIYILLIIGNTTGKITLEFLLLYPVSVLEPTSRLSDFPSLIVEYSQSNPHSHTTKVLRPIVMSFHLHLTHPCDLFLLLFQPKLFLHFSFSLCMLTRSLHLTPIMPMILVKRIYYETFVGFFSLCCLLSPLHTSRSGDGHS